MQKILDLFKCCESRKNNDQDNGSETSANDLYEDHLEAELNIIDKVTSINNENDFFFKPEWIREEEKDIFVFVFFLLI